MPSEKDIMLAGEMYLAGDPEIVAMRRKARMLLHKFNHSAPDDPDHRRLILQDLLGQMGQNLEIEPHFNCDYGSNIFVGDNVYMNFGCILLDCNTIQIGNNVMFGPSVQIYTAYHPLEAKARNSGRELAAPVSIGDNVWLGGGVMVCPKVTIGKNTVIGTGAVVTKSMPDNVFAAGNPCRVIKEIDNTDLP